MDRYFSELVRHGWTVSNGETGDLSACIKNRFDVLPDNYLRNLSGIRSCTAPDMKQWFLTLADYNGLSESAFTWDEFERLSLDAADDDEDWRAEITHFWDRHFPIFQSVRDGYQFAAIKLDEVDFGKVVLGREPEFEEVDIVAESVSEFMCQITAS